MTRTVRLGAALLASGLLAGCASYVHTPFLPGAETARAARLGADLGTFDYIDHRPQPMYSIVDEDANYRTENLAFRSVGANGQPGDLVTARYHQGKRPGAKPLVIVLPIWSMQTYPFLVSGAVRAMQAYPSNTMVDGLRAHSAGAVSVLQILGQRPLFDLQAVAAAGDQAEFFRRLRQMRDRFVNTVIDTRRVVDWAQSQPDIDPQRIALIGFSISALVASVAIANEPRLAAAVLVMGGADLHEILATCNQEVQAARERILAHFGWSLDQYKRALEPALAGINPARFAGMADPSRILMIEAGYDTCVPKSSRERFWRAFGRPERIAYQYDHRVAFLAMTFLGGHSLEHQVYRFLDQRFAEPGARLQLSRRAGQSSFDNASR